MRKTQVQRHSTKRLAVAPPHSAKVVKAQGRLRNCHRAEDTGGGGERDNCERCGVLDWILEFGENVSGKTGDAHVESGPELALTRRCWSLSFDKYARVMGGVHNRENRETGAKVSAPIKLPRDQTGIFVLFIHQIDKGHQANSARSTGSQRETAVSEEMRGARKGSLVIQVNHP